MKAYIAIVRGYLHHLPEAVMPLVSSVRTKPEDVLETVEHHNKYRLRHNRPPVTLIRIATCEITVDNDSAKL